MAKFYTLLAAILVLSACETLQEFQPSDQPRLGTIHRPDPTFSAADQFSTALARKYWLMSESGTNYRQSSDARWFADKALRAGKGIHVDPEHPEDWNIRYSALPALKKARRELLDMISGGVIKIAPEKSANAYYLYDCWVEQESYWQVQQTTVCRPQFFEIMNRLSLISAEHSTSNTTPNTPRPMQQPQSLVATLDDMDDEMAEETEPDAQPESTEIARNKDIQPIIIPFKCDSTELDPAQQPHIDKAASYGLQLSEKRIIINGHTDRVGTEEANFSLSRERANRVRDSMIERGVLAKQMLVFGFGETDPTTITEDEIREPANCRVTVIFN